MALDEGRGCPGPERLAEYADGVLPPEDRLAVERHLAECADCRAVVADTMAFVETQSDRGVRLQSDHPAGARVVPFPARRWVIGIGAALAAAAAVILAVRVVRPDITDQPELQELIAAVSKEPTRPVEGRLTGGFRHARAPVPTRGASDRPISTDVRIAALRVEDAARNVDTPAGEAARGVAFLVEGNTSEAIAALKRSTDRSANPLVLSDLAVAYLHSCRTEADTCVKALDAADNALRIEPDLVQAMFNRALALEAMNRIDDSAAAWRRYLEADAMSPWADEARQRLAALSQRKP